METSYLLYLQNSPHGFWSEGEDIDGSMSGTIAAGSLVMLRGHFEQHHVRTSLFAF